MHVVLETKKKRVKFIINPLNYICHRKPERSFHIKGHQFPVCARCTGLYLGIISFFIFYFIQGVIHNLFLLIFSVVLVIPCLVDGLTQRYGNRLSNNTLRLFTGLIAGYGLMLFAEEVEWIILSLI